MNDFSFTVSVMMSDGVEWEAPPLPGIFTSVSLNIVIKED
jgi:hypothetical protein